MRQLLDLLGNGPRVAFAAHGEVVESPGEGVGAGGEERLVRDETYD
jgi:hypothetical protein